MGDPTAPADDPALKFGLDARMPDRTVRNDAVGGAGEAGSTPAEETAVDGTGEPTV